MSRFASDTIVGFLDNVISHLLETHDPDVDGSSTGSVISIYEQLKDRINASIPYSYRRALYIAEQVVDIEPDHGETLHVSDIETLADEVNSWD